MKCNNCGAELEDGARFCAECGTPISDVAEAVTEAATEAVKAEETVEQAAETVEETTEQVASEAAETVTEQAAAFDPMTGAPVQEQNVSFDPMTGAPVQEQAVEFDPMTGAPVEKKKSKAGLVVGILVAVLIVAVAGCGFLFKDKLFGGKVSSDTIFLVSNNKLKVVKDITAKEPEAAEIMKLKGDEGYYYGHFYDGGKYFYFFSKVDEYDGVGTLNRVKVFSLGKDEDKNEAAVEEIDSKVSVYAVHPAGNGDGLLYIRNGNKLMYFDGKETNEIAKKVDNFEYSNSAKSGFYATEYDDDGECELGTFNLDGDTDELEDHVYYYSFVTDGISFEMNYDEDDNTCDFYYAPYGKKAELIAKEISYEFDHFDPATKHLYFLKGNEEEVCLYDYVDDPYADDDADVHEPSDIDALEPATEEEAIGENNREYINNWYDGNVEEYLMSYGYEDDGYYVIYNYDNYEQYYYNPTNGNWYHYNDDLYDEAYEKYYDARDRIELREELKESEVTISSYDLYFTDGSDEKLLAENVDSNNIYSFSDGVVYTLLDTATMDKVDIDDIYGAYEVEEHLLYGSDYYYDDDDDDDDDDETEIVYYASMKGADAKEVLKTTGSIQNADYGYGDDDTILVFEVQEEYGELPDLYMLDLSSKSPEAVLIEEEAISACVEDNAVYYYADIDIEEDDVDESEGTLMKYENGKSVEIAKDVAVNASQYLMNDGTLIKYTDPDYDDYPTTYEVVLVKDGKEKSLDDEVTEVEYMENDKILYIADGDLYIYNGKESIKIDKNVEKLFSYGSSSYTYLGAYIRWNYYDY